MPFIINIRNAGTKYMFKSNASYILFFKILITWNFSWSVLMMTAAGIEIIVIDINPTTTLYRFVGSIRSKLSEKENSSATGNATKIKLFIWRVITLSIDWMLDDSKSLATRLVILQETIKIDVDLTIQNNKTPYWLSHFISKVPKMQLEEYWTEFKHYRKVFRPYHPQSLRLLLTEARLLVAGWLTG